MECKSDSRNDIPTSEQLRAAAKDYLNQNGKPEVSIDVSFIDLSKSENYRDVAELQTVRLCDTVNVYFEKLGISTKAEVVKTSFDTLKNRYESVTLGTIKPTVSVLVNNSIEKSREDIKTWAESSVSEINSEIDKVRNSIPSEIDGKIEDYDVRVNGKIDDVHYRINDVVTQQREDYTSLTKDNDDITAKVGSLTTKTEEYDEKFAGLDDEIDHKIDTTVTEKTTTIIQNDSSIQAVIAQSSNLNEQINGSEGITKQILDIKTYVTVDGDGLKIAKDGSSMNSLFTNDQMQFRDNNTVVAYISGKEFYITNGTITGRLQFQNGKHTGYWQMDAQGRMVLKRG